MSTENNNTNKMLDENIKNLFIKIAKVLVIVGFLIYTLLVSIKIASNSDLANMVLEANDILHGNFFLSNWYLTGITFITTDMLCYLLSTAIFGIDVKSVILSTYLMILLNFVLGMLIIRDDVKNLKFIDFIYFIGFWGLAMESLSTLRIHGVCFAFIFLALFFCNRYIRNNNKKDLIILGLIIGLTTLGDMIMVTGCALPIIICAFLKLWNEKDLKKYLPLIFTSIVAIIVGLVLLKLYLYIGQADYNSWTMDREFIVGEKFTKYLSMYVNQLLYLQQADFYGQELLKMSTLNYFIRGIITIVGAVVALDCVRKIFTNKPIDFLSACLSVGFVLQSLLLIVSTYTLDVFSCRYFGFAQVGFIILIMRNWNCFDNLNKKQTGMILTALLIGIFLSVENNLSFKTQETKADRIKEFAISKNLEHGIAEFWDASEVTLQSNNKVKIRALSVYKDTCDVTPYNWFSKKDWYDEPVQFVVAPPESVECLENIYAPQSKEIHLIDDLKIFVLKDEFIRPLGKKSD